jgi:hypothetical protein
MDDLAGNILSFGGVTIFVRVRDPVRSGQGPRSFGWGTPFVRVGYPVRSGFIPPYYRGLEPGIRKVHAPLQALHVHVFVFAYTYHMIYWGQSRNYLPGTLSPKFVICN